MAEDKAALVLKALPMCKRDDKELYAADVLEGLIICNVSKDLSEDSLRTLISYRRGLRVKCSGLDRKSSGAITTSEFAKALQCERSCFYLLHA